MSLLPIVTSSTRERIAMEFDDKGPNACMIQVEDNWRRHNPELLDMALKCARSLGDHNKIMLGFCMFYRLLLTSAAADSECDWLSPLPRVTEQTRNDIVRAIDRTGPEEFTTEAIALLQADNPELLQMAHGFASRQKDYLSVMQGFALLYRSLHEQFAADRRLLH